MRIRRLRLALSYHEDCRVTVSREQSLQYFSMHPSLYDTRSSPMLPPKDLPQQPNIFLRAYLSMDIIRRPIKVCLSNISATLPIYPP